MIRGCDWFPFNTAYKFKINKSELIYNKNKPQHEMGIMETISSKLFVLGSEWINDKSFRTNFLNRTVDEGE